MNLKSPNQKILSVSLCQLVYPKIATHERLSAEPKPHFWMSHHFLLAFCTQPETLSVLKYTEHVFATDQKTRWHYLSKLVSEEQCLKE